MVLRGSDAVECGHGIDKMVDTAKQPVEVMESRQMLVPVSVGLVCPKSFRFSQQTLVFDARISAVPHPGKKQKEAYYYLGTSIKSFQNTIYH